MPKLPSAQNAIIPIEKLRDYSLNLSHLEGKHKARKFHAVLGLGPSDAEFLRAIVFQGIQSQEAVKGSKDIYGQRYSVDLLIETKSGSATVRTAWIIRESEGFPRLTSIYVT